MEYNDQEYLNLFKQVKEQRPENSFNGQMIKETPDYNNFNSFNSPRVKETPDYNNYYNSPMIKETPDYSGYEGFRNQPNLNEVRRQNYSMDFNISEFNIETRINGENINEVRRQDKEDRLNEVKEHLRQQRLNEVKETQERQNLNEVVNFNDVDYVTIEMFEKARYNSMMQVAKRILPK